jgi:hypothetical protein
MFLSQKEKRKKKRIAMETGTAAREVEETAQN